jgi:CBS domain containing-hemolysin-like protein
MDVDAPHEATIGGHVAERLGRLPDPDEVLDIDGARLTVLAVDDTRITALRA